MCVSLSGLDYHPSGPDSSVTFSAAANHLPVHIPPYLDNIKRLLSCLPSTSLGPSILHTAPHPLPPPHAPQSEDDYILQWLLSNLPSTSPWPSTATLTASQPPPPSSFRTEVGKCFVGPEFSQRGFRGFRRTPSFLTVAIDCVARA